MSALCEVFDSVCGAVQELTALPAPQVNVDPRAPTLCEGVEIAGMALNSPCVGLNCPEYCAVANTPQLEVLSPNAAPSPQNQWTQQQDLSLAQRNLSPPSGMG